MVSDNYFMKILLMAIDFDNHLFEFLVEGNSVSDNLFMNFFLKAIFFDIDLSEFLVEGNMLSEVMR